MKRDEVGEAMKAAINARVQRHARKERASVEAHPRRWQPPRCSNCRRKPADVEERDYDPTRPWFCGWTCFRLFRDHLHGQRGVLEAPISIQRAESGGYDDI
jgi:hypothetical protein